MAKTTIIFGIALIVLGVLGYTGSEPKSPAGDPPAAEASEGATTDSEPPNKSITALIPAFVGVLLVLFGAIALKESLKKHAMHGAVLVGLLGALAGAGRGSMGIGKFLAGDPELNQRSFLFVWLMAILCGVFVFLCVQSFIAARKRQQAEAGAS